MSMHENKQNESCKVSGKSLFFRLEIALFVILAVLVLFLRPFWINVQQFFMDKTHLDFPWMWSVVAGCCLGALTLSLVHNSTKGLHGKKGKIIFYGGGIFCAVLLVFSYSVIGFVLYMLLINNPLILLGQCTMILPAMLFFSMLILLCLVFPSFSWWKSYRIRLGGVILAGLFVLIGWIFPTPLQIMGGPWLQFAENGGITVCWMTNLPSTGEVAYGDEFQHTAHTQHFGLLETSRIHRITLTDVQPGSCVKYRVLSKEIREFYPYSVLFGQTVTSSAYTMKVPARQSDKVKFLVLSDVHEMTSLLSCYTRMDVAKDIDFVVFNGDFFSNMDSEYQFIKHFLEPVSATFGPTIPLVYVRGNHEARGAYARNLVDYVSLPGNPFLASLQMGPANFLVLDTGEDKEDSHREYSGLVDFKKWRAEESALLPPIISSRDWKETSFRILLAHIPLSRFPDWTEELTKAGLDLQLAGHEHVQEFHEQAGRFPIAIVSGDSRRNPKAYAAAFVTVTKDLIDINMVFQSGESAAHWTVPAKQ